MYFMSRINLFVYNFPPFHGIAVKKYDNERFDSLADPLRATHVLETAGRKKNNMCFLSCPMTSERAHLGLKVYNFPFEARFWIGNDFDSYAEFPVGNLEYCKALSLSARAIPLRVVGFVLAMKVPLREP